MMGLKSQEDIEIKDFLKNIRRLSEKRFRNVYKKNKLISHMHPSFHRNQTMVNKYPM